MATLKRVDPFSAFKVGFVAYAVIGLIAAVFCSLIAIASPSLAMHVPLHFPRALGLMALIVCPILYGLIGGVTAVLGALLYNLAARWTGGVEIQIS